MVWQHVGCEESVPSVYSLVSSKTRRLERFITNLHRNNPLRERGGLSLKQWISRVLSLLPHDDPLAGCCQVKLLAGSVRIGDTRSMRSRN
jgi:hypothetical protein